MRGFEADEKMHMICDATDSLRCAAQAANRAAEIFVEAMSPFCGQERFPVFRGKHEMIEERGVGRGHGDGLLAPLPGMRVKLSLISF